MKYITLLEEYIRNNEENKVIMSDVNDKDAKKLIKWWNANTKYYHFKKRNGRNKFGKFDVVRQLEKFEVLEEIQKDDYVIVKVNPMTLYPNLDEYLNNTIGKVVYVVSDQNYSLGGRVKKIKEYIVMYLDVPQEFENWFTRKEWNKNSPKGYYRTFPDYRIEFSGKTIEDVEMKLSTQKYNIG